jgi:hypothetical protein
VRPLQTGPFDFSPGDLHKAEMAGRSVARRYSVEQIDRAPSAAVYWDGNTRRAAAALKGQGLDIPRSTLKDWVTNSHRERYMELRKKLEPEIHARAAERHRELVSANIELETDIIKRLREELPNLAARAFPRLGATPPSQPPSIRTST